MCKLGCVFIVNNNNNEYFDISFHLIYTLPIYRPIGQGVYLWILKICNYILLKVICYVRALKKCLPFRYGITGSLIMSFPVISLEGKCRFTIIENREKCVLNVFFFSNSHKFHFVQRRYIFLILRNEKILCCGCRISRTLKNYPVLSGWVFANGPENRGSISGRVIPKTPKIVLDTSMLNTQYYKVHFKGKLDQFMEWVAPSPTPQCSRYWKGSFRVALDYGRQLI